MMMTMTIKMMMINYFYLLEILYFTIFYIKANHEGENFQKYYPHSLNFYEILSLESKCYKIEVSFYVKNIFFILWFIFQVHV